MKTSRKTSNGMVKVLSADSAAILVYGAVSNGSSSSAVSPSLRIKALQNTSRRTRCGIASATLLMTVPAYPWPTRIKSVRFLSRMKSTTDWVDSAWVTFLATSFPWPATVGAKAVWPSRSRCSITGRHVEPS